MSLPSVPRFLAPALLIGCLVAPAGAGAGVEQGPRPVFGPRAPQKVTPAGNGWLRVSTVPAKRASDSVGINLDTWSRTGAYTPARWPGLMQSLRASGITRARVDVHLVSGDWGTQRQVEMGKAGFKLTVQLGDAFGRYSATPLDRVYDVFRTHLLPYSEAVEGTNEPDIAGPLDWGTTALAHQRAIVSNLAATPGADRLAVFAPSTARPANQRWYGDLTGLADYANAHAYSGGRYGALGFDMFVPPAEQLLPGGPTVVTETGVHTSPEGTYSQPGVSEAVAARYAPKGLLEAFRRGIPRTYLFDLVDRFDDPELKRVEAHFGLLRTDGTPKPAFAAISRLMSELSDSKGKVGTPTRPVAIRPRQPLPPDVRSLALRHSDGSLVLALWRERSLWDTVAAKPIAAPTASVHLDLGERYVLGRVRELATGRLSWQLPFLGGLDLKLGDDVTIVRLTGRLR
ncbi:MAG: hypothetical protein JHD16_10865 [Solirubrobacteraceae bacterium]|nr:hypothetical protein [Solirubrobacteraceae bacterium]